MLNIHNLTIPGKPLKVYFEVTENICVIIWRSKNSYWCFCFQLYRCWTWERQKSWKTSSVDIHDMWKRIVNSCKNRTLYKYVKNVTKIVTCYFSLQNEKFTTHPHWNKLKQTWRTTNFSFVCEFFRFIILVPPQNCLQ